MSELKEISVIVLTKLSKALHSAALEISKSMEKELPIIESLPPPLKVGISVLFKDGKRRYWAEIIKIEGEVLTVENKAVNKTFIIHTSEVLMRNDINYDLDNLPI